MRAPGLGCLIVGASLAGASAPVTAQSESVEGSYPPAKTQMPAEDTGLSLEFLEFLGEWESDSGEWVDPVEVESVDWPIVSNDPSDTNDAETGNAN
jgi:hypothetical protein